MTSTTVGYGTRPLVERNTFLSTCLGDIYPYDDVGRVVAIVAALTGIVTTSLLVSVLTNRFAHRCTDGKHCRHDITGWRLPRSSSSSSTG